jgi:hypothetical protein
MPFIRGDASAFDEMLEELGPDVVQGDRPTDDFVYESAKAKFVPKKFAKRPQMMLSALLAAGATAFRVSYDGGFDEGFSHPQAVVFGAKERTIKQTLDEVGSAELAGELRESMKKDKWSADRAKTEPDRAIVTDALNDLAHEIASVLLGDGYGTGEYQLYGAFTADLKTGAITDDATAKRPRGME